jgi:nanoRNase/pAp phosphatase (c-di-AMP/oligoRNAs hydrolase)
MPINAKQYKAALDLIDASKKAFITTHIRPDGDACGCVRAIMEGLSAMGKQVQPLLLSPLSSWYESIFPHKIPILGNDIKKEELAAKYADIDLIIIVDTNSLVQLPGLEDWLKGFRASGKKILVIDHHVTSDNLGDVELIDDAASAAGEIVYDFFKAVGWAITPAVAEAIFIAVSTDTGWFKYGNADSRIFHTAADLIQIGVKPNEIFRRMYQSFTPSRLKLMTRMLEHLELHANGRVATQYILRKDFDETGSSGPDTENLIDECQRIQTVEVAVLFVELADGRFRCSLRSKGKVDVRKITQKFGGGGHTLASGVNLQGPFDSAKTSILQEILTQL